MGQLNIRLDDHTRDALEALARARDVTVSDLTRSIIDEALGRGDPRRRQGDPTPRSLSAIERRVLAMNHQILAHLIVDPDEQGDGLDAEYHRNMVEVLESGWTTEYADMFEAFRPEITRRECSLVHDILDMFRTLEHSFRELNDEERASLGEHAEYALVFRGFDFNDAQEGRFASYARYLIRTGRWESMAEHFDAKHEHGNSHAPMLASYQRMLSIWQPMWEKKLHHSGGPRNYFFSPEELREIQAAWPHPRD